MVKRMSSVRAQSKRVRAIAVEGHIYFVKGILMGAVARTEGKSEVILVLSLSVSANSYSNAKRRGWPNKKNLDIHLQQGFKKNEKQRLQLV